MGSVGNIRFVLFSQDLSSLRVGSAKAHPHGAGSSGRRLGDHLFREIHPRARWGRAGWGGAALVWGLRGRDLLHSAYHCPPLLHPPGTFILGQAPVWNPEEDSVDPGIAQLLGDCSGMSLDESVYAARHGPVAELPFFLSVRILAIVLFHGGRVD